MTEGLRLEIHMPETVAESELAALVAALISASVAAFATAPAVPTDSQGVDHDG